MLIADFCNFNINSYPTQMRLGGYSKWQLDLNWLSIKIECHLTSLFLYVTLVGCILYAAQGHVSVKTFLFTV